ncbi:MAG: aldo/keto reductase [Chitinophagaceae bacterium]
MNTVISPIAGCMRWGKWGANFTTYDYEHIINQCVENGIVAFDHADIYGDYTTEADFGKAVKHKHTLRSTIKIITKCGIQLVSNNRPHHQIKSYNTTNEHIINSVEQSLQNFHTDYIDVLLIHRPSPLLNPVEVADAVTQLIQQGKILQFGVSNFLPHQIDAIKKSIEISYNQIELSIFNLNPFTDGTLDNCLQNNIRPMAWSPLGGGVLNEDEHPKFRLIYSTASSLAEKYNTGINQILIAFLLKHPSQVLPVVGTTKIERLLQVKEASTINLTTEDWFKLYAASNGEDVA